MKRYLMGLALALSLNSLLSAPISAQPVAGSRALSAHELKAVKWSNFQRVSHKQYAAEFAAIQYLLRNQGFYKGKPDGIFGPQTENAVKSFQRAKGLKVDGIIGAQTWPKLVPRLRRGDHGDAVRALQVILKGYQSDSGERVYPSIVVDGNFGKQTETALRDIQANYGSWHPHSALKVDGIVGAQTWCVLFLGEIRPHKA